MKEISITGFDLSTMCRLCLSSADAVIDLFSFSTSFEDLIANTVMKCAPVQIRSFDEMPNFICQICYNRLEKTHQFQMQIVQSEKTLQHYLKQLHAFNKENSIQRPSDDPLIDNTNADITLNCESSKLDDIVSALSVDKRHKECEHFQSVSKINHELTLKSKISDGQITENSSNPAECPVDRENTLSKGGENTAIKIEDNKLEAGENPNFNSACNTNEEMSTKFEIKVEQMDDNSLISAECADNTIETLSEDGGIEISSGDSKIDIVDIKFVENLDVNWKENEPSNLNSAFKSIEKMFLKAEIKDEPMDGSLVRTESIDDTVDDFSKGDTEISWEDTTIGFGHTSEKSVYLSSSDMEECFKKSEEGSKNSPSNREKHKKEYKMESHQLNINDACSSRLSGCKKSYTNSRFLNTGKLKHTGEKPYKCDVCNKCFTQSRYLNAHKLYHTGEKPYKCDVCEKCYTQLGNLNTHKRTHTGEKPYQCDVCKKCFTLLSVLNAHKRTHTGEKPYQCDVCKMCFTQLASLNAHKRTHTGEKPYQCDVCKMSFTQLSTLNAHKRTHTGEKPYHCNICNKRFFSSNELKLHIRTHTGEKPYQCDVCKKCFTQSCTLTTHKLKHTGEKQY